jgi:2-isopropylmalate synthase
VQTEYIYHVSPDQLKETVADAIFYAKALTPDVEFFAEDAARADRGFLYEMIEAAAEAGATAITLSDSEGTFLPDEFAEFTRDIMENANTSAAHGVILGVCCSNTLAMADACTTAALRAGATEAKASVYGSDTASLRNIASIISRRGSGLGLSCGIRTVEMDRVCGQIERMFTATRSKTSPFENGVQDNSEGRFYTESDDISAIIKETEVLGYDLSEDDKVKVYEHFKTIAAKKEKVSSRELDAIVASSAMQVPPTYKIDDYIINSGNTISATPHIRIMKNGELKESVAIGDGSVDASFLAREQIAGRP